MLFPQQVPQNIQNKRAPIHNGCSKVTCGAKKDLHFHKLPNQNLHQYRQRGPTLYCRRYISGCFTFILFLIPGDHSHHLRFHA